jgi:uncharacterized membrane protein
VEYIQYGVFWGKGFFAAPSNIFLTSENLFLKSSSACPEQERAMHYFPISLPFMLILFFIFLVLLILIEIGILGYAYRRLGLNRRWVFALLLLSLLGSYINIPVYKLPPETLYKAGHVTFYGVQHVIPIVTHWPGTVIAVNIGGAIIPTLLSIYLIIRNRLFFRALLGIGIVTLVVHYLATPIRGVGIAEPIFIPPLVATAAALIISRRLAPALAYISGSMGTLIGADLLNIYRLQGLGAPVASIGGAGTFDGIFMTGILAVLLAAIFSGRSRPEPDGGSQE